MRAALREQVRGPPVGSVRTRVRWVRGWWRSAGEISAAPSILFWLAPNAHISLLVTSLFFTSHLLHPFYPLPQHSSTSTRTFHPFLKPSTKLTCLLPASHSSTCMKTRPHVLPSKTYKPTCNCLPILQFPIPQRITILATPLVPHINYMQRLNESISLSAFQAFPPSTVVILLRLIRSSKNRHSSSPRLLLTRPIQTLLSSSSRSPHKPRHATPRPRPATRPP